MANLSWNFVALRCSVLEWLRVEDRFWANSIVPWEESLPWVAHVHMCNETLWQSRAWIFLHLSTKIASLAQIISYILAVKYCIYFISFLATLTLSLVQHQPKFNGRETIQRCNFLPNFIRISSKMWPGSWTNQLLEMYFIRFLATLTLNPVQIQQKFNGRESLLRRSFLPNFIKISAKLRPESWTNRLLNTDIWLSSVYQHVDIQSSGHRPEDFEKKHCHKLHDTEISIRLLQ